MAEKEEKKRARDFNSQPHKEADYADGKESVTGVISTHSLTRRLTTAR